MGKDKAITITDNTYFVFYGTHDSGSDAAGVMTRESMKAAERTARLLDECGYTFTDVRHAASVAELPTA